VHPETGECQVLVVQDVDAISALTFRNALVELGPWGLCSGPGLASGTEYSRRRSSTLDPSAPDKRDVDLVLSRAEYARRRSFDPGLSDAVRNIQAPSTLGGDLSIPVSRMRFGISKCRVRSAEIFRSRYLGCGSEYPRAEYARRRPSTLGPEISGGLFRKRIRSWSLGSDR